jgi:hypothetical protein
MRPSVSSSSSSSPQAGQTKPAHPFPSPTRQAAASGAQCILLFNRLRRGADKSLAFPIFLFAAQPKRIFLGCVKEVRTTKS